MKWAIFLQEGQTPFGVRVRACVCVCVCEHVCEPVFLLVESGGL